MPRSQTIQAVELRRMKMVALALLVAAAALFVVATVAGAEGFWGYVQAIAEAAMVGALADWFAVTALFRHPLGIPIPHTAIIARRKDQIGASLGDFVEENFLTAELIGERLAQADIARRIGVWLQQESNARRAAAVAADGLRAVLEVFDDDQVQAGLERVVAERLDRVDLAPIAGRAIGVSIDGGHHVQLFDAVIEAIQNFLGDSKSTFRDKLYEESPWWVPEAVDDRVLDKIYDVATRFLLEVRDDPDHEIRRAIVGRLADFGERLQSDPELSQRGHRLKAELLEHPEVRSWFDSMWISAKAALIEMADDPNSELRSRMWQSYQRFGERLVTQPQVRATLDQWIQRGGGYLVEHYRSEVSSLIETTVARWDGASTAERMELQVGKDLQFIRINGTIVGGLAGFVIHLVAELL